MLRLGYAFGPSTTWQDEFADGFPYRLTEDQLAAWRDVERDMEAEKPMDRLVCGDVGFGKTEVAMRAAFKACVEKTGAGAVPDDRAGRPALQHVLPPV
jgi:transcription-repair coupling factor (superfamily II helicase)